MVDEDIRNALMTVADGGPLSIDDLCTSVVRTARRRRQRQVAAGAVAVVALAVSMWALRPTGSEPVITVGSMPVPETPGGSVAASTDPNTEEYVDPAKAARYPGWLAEYDPAEVAYLRSVDPSASDAKLVVTLEYRRACRSTDAAVTELSAADPSVVPERARTLMTPVVERLTERETSAKSGADDQFASLTDRLATGDIAGVRAWVDVNCASSFAQSVPGAIEGQVATGWLPYGGDDALEPDRPPSDLWGWIKYGENVEPGKANVYDSADGTIIGFAYAELGFVSLADDPGFDAHAERIERFGCDQYVDEACSPLDRLGPDAPVPRPAPGT